MKAGRTRTSHSQRIEVTQANTVDQIRPYPGLNMLDPETEEPLPATDPRQLMNSFGLINYVVSVCINKNAGKTINDLHI